ncbi:MAG: low molecular weight phosphotyrosine protein phosphatase [Saprospiraceae bacterium]|nr:low molecular weight phosphotyrosine protein phosphatase [Saprospiraceae bacterium]MBK7360614.1 low molecular weight phosphotyrosine protein phosphatase [Saprospiraceae bacterium]MBK7736405.1 low molecular weight phosphotyrosine protein phosphatase [Saprospiraceae bacterium]MBK7912230.1 low molecular weight phosphotyrosine protein phosphatase [Saprospiraceae bacterium]
MKILMVCLGNICRSPMAHGFMQGLIEAHQLDWTVDSAGTNGYHDGEHPDPRAIQEMKTHGLDISKQVSRKIQKHDLETFDLILTMDHENLSYVKKLSKDLNVSNKIHLLLDFSGNKETEEVPDPYYDNRFKEAGKLIQDACKQIVTKYS